MSLYDYGKNGEVDWFLLTACLSADTTVDTVKGLIDGYATPDAYNTFLKEPAIVSAIKCGNEPIALELAKNIKNLNASDKENRTPLIHAVIAEMEPVIECLLERGANKDIYDNDGKCAKDYLSKITSVEIIELFSDEVKEPEDEKETIQLFDLDIVEEARDKENNQKRKHYLNQLIESGDTRLLHSLEDNVIDEVMKLKDSFPNFAEVIDFYLRQLALIKLDKNKTIRFIPVLMSGPPGVGKTRFAKELARTLKLEFNLVACSTVTAGFVIGGANTMWESGRPGLVTNALRDGVWANPIIQLDEVDKMGGDFKHDPFGPLYSFLETETAQSFVDEALEIPLDLSHINWLATANHLSTIPEPILSRFVVINVVEPTKEQMLNITQSIYTDVLNSFPNWGSSFNDSLPKNIAKEFVSLPPRKIRQLMIDACGRSAQRSKDNEGDSLIITNEDIEVAYAKGKANIGFVN
ncbi:MAG: AAA family ATPase [Proteobacteria bacterium]|nr:AAA family ATPase [Pseudomonadota bacterium]NOG58860.1 AAA family ATPase [Pseudomonadota bacterium]